MRTIEQILGLPPMNIMDATALPMFDCFSNTPKKTVYSFVKNNVPLNEMNKDTASLKGKAKKFAEQLMLPEFAHIDGGNDDCSTVYYGLHQKETRLIQKKILCLNGRRKTLMINITKK